jgi:hypothetical protein
MAKKQDKRKNPGQPMSDEERRNRPWLQINHHSIRMMVRRDNGGNPLEGMPQVMAKLFVGKTALEAGEIATEAIRKRDEGHRNRQKKGVDENERRIKCLKGAIENGLSDNELRRVVIDVVFGEGNEPPTTPSEHILR